MKDYDRYMKSRHWRAKRIQYMKSPKTSNDCAACNKRYQSNFHLHHKTYERFGNEDLDDLVMLCERCHSDVHKFHESNVDLYRAARMAIPTLKELTELFISKAEEKVPDIVPKKDRKKQYASPEYYRQKLSGKYCQ